MNKPAETYVLRVVCLSSKMNCTADNAALLLWIFTKKVNADHHFC